MKSLVNQAKELLYKGETAAFIENLDNFETNHYELRNEYLNLEEEFDQLKYELAELKKSDSNALTDISKKLSKTLKNEGEKELVIQFQLNRAKIMDHFTMAYIAELNLKPSQVKLVQGVNDEGFVEMYFEKHSNLILPDSAK